MKKVKLAGAVLVLLYASYWMVYKSMLSKANEEWYQERYVNQEIEGKLHRIHEYSITPYKVALIIKDDLISTDLTYGAICMSEEFRSYIAVGDSIYKQAGQKTLLFCKSKNDCKEFELVFCE